jgi:N-acetylmuramoyl-L-alanine amidase
MLFSVKIASMVAVAATMTAAVTTTGARAVAQDLVPTLVTPEVTPAVFIPAPAPGVLGSVAAPDQTAPQAAPATLDGLVDAQAKDADLSSEMKCLAGAVYFEAKGETLDGQLAVARVIVERSKSGRFPESYCGVVYQPSQFSFVHGRGMPAIKHDTRSWRQAVAIAQIADSGSWKSRTEGALYFHAARVAPHWRVTKLARIDDHIFYR